MSRRYKVFLMIACIVLIISATTFVMTDFFFTEENNYSGIEIENNDEVADFIRACLEKHSWQITIELSVHTDNIDEIEEMVDELMEEALKETDKPSQGDYIRFQYGGYEVKYECSSLGRNQYNYVIRIIPDYYTTPKQEDEVTRTVEAVIAGFDFDENTSEYEKIKTIYDYIYNTVSYDVVHKHKENNHIKTTAYSAIKYNTAVCQGYAVLMYRMLRECGVSARIITGTVIEEGKEQLHAWNIVRIDDKYYNLDVTWNKALETEEYFLKSDDSFVEHLRSENYLTDEFYMEYPMSETDYVTENDK